MIDLTKVNYCIANLEIANKAFLYGYVQTNGGKHQSTFLCGSDFNEIKWNISQPDQLC